MSDMNDIYAELPEDDIYADLEDELNKAGYNPEQLLTGPTSVSVPAPALPNRNQTVTVKESPRPVNQVGNYKAKKEKTVQNQKKPNPKKQAPQTQNKPNPTMMGAPLVSKDMLNQRLLLKKVGERVEPRKGEDPEAKVDFRANLRKVQSPAKKPPPLLKPKPSLSSIPIDPKKICYKRKPLTSVDISNPPVIDREKKPRLILDTENYDENAFEDDVNGDLYDDVELITGAQVNGSESTEPDVYDDVENLNPDLVGEYYDDVECLTRGKSPELYDDVENVGITRDKSPELYDDVENVGITRDKSPELYDDVENVGTFRDKSPELYDDVDNVGITRGKSPELYDDVDNVGITRGKSPELYDDVDNVGFARNTTPGLYDDVENVGSLVQFPIKEELYDEVPESRLESKPIRPKLSASQEKKRKTEELKLRKKQQELEEKRQKETEKNAKELKKKRKVFFDYYNIKEGDKPILVAQVTSENDLRGKQNLSVEVGSIVHVLCKQHKKMPKGAWLAEKSDRSAIGFITPEILNQNMLPSYNDEALYSTTD